METEKRILAIVGSPGWLAVPLLLASVYTCCNYFKSKKRKADDKRAELQVMVQESQRVQEEKLTRVYGPQSTTRPSKSPWRIPIFDHDPLEDSMSPALGLADLQGEWNLVMTPRLLSKRDNEPKEREFLGLHLRQETMRGCDFPTRLCLRILTSDGLIVYQRDSVKPVLFSSKTEGTVMWVWERFVCHGDLFNPTKGYLTANDSLILQAEVHSLIATRSIRERNVVLPPECLPSCCLKMDHTRLYMERTGADFVVVSKEGARYLAHSHVVIARSNCFRAMLANSVSDRTEGVCKLEDLDGTCVDTLLEYLYCGTCTEAKMEKSGEKLLTVADSYCRETSYLINGLKQKCEFSLLTSATVHNAARLLILADTYSAKDLKLRIKQLSAARLPAFVTAEGFRTLGEFSGGELVEELIDFVRDGLPRKITRKKLK